MAIMFAIAVAAVAAVIFGTFIGGVLLFLSAVSIVSGAIAMVWWAYREHQNEKK